ncbi:hypothetical protein PSm6_23280 [Pseudomonas solani]|uniref:Uncharacterized protein n=1 Tax=Pseudomonas solani TaxID=2731552 RepID=A0ABM7L8N0_9PSED|nr:hypothetical protein PSm6_23280 [Pseudomonas solani]
MWERIHPRWCSSTHRRWAEAHPTVCFNSLRSTYHIGVRMGFRKVGRAAFRERSETHAVEVADSLARSPQAALWERIHPR